MQFRQLIIFLVVLFFIATVFVPVGAGLASPGDDTSASPLERGNGQPATIDSALEDTSGEVEVVLRFTERSPGAIRTTAAENQPAAMRTHAANTQSPFLQFAEGNPHIEITSQLWLANAVVVTVDTDRIPLERLAERQNVERIHENYAVQGISAASVGDTQLMGSSDSVGQSQSPLIPSSTAEASSFTRALSYSNVPDAWETYNTRGDGVRVAVIDTGVNPDHPDIDIDNENWACYTDCAGNPSGPHDNNGHGTHVSGTIVGGNANDAGLHIGVAPEATLMHAKGLGDDNSGSFESIINSMQWAVDNDADILSMSLGAYGKFGEFIDPVRNAQASGTIVIVASGNDGAGTSASPGNIYDAIAVGSVDVEPAFPSNWDFGLEDGTVSVFSSGESVNKNEFSNPPAEWPDSYIVPDVTSPGSIIWSANNNDDHEFEICDDAPTDDLTCLAGTSMATPHVAGAAALMQSATAEQLTPDTIQSALRSTAVDGGEPETRQGSGRLDVAAAVGAVADDDSAASFELTDVDPKDADLSEGDTLAVDVTVTNIGSAAGTESITLNVDADQDGTFEQQAVDSHTVENLAAGATETVTLTYETQVGDSPAVAVQAVGSTDERSATASVAAAEPFFSITGVTPQSDEVTAGDPLALTVTVNNTGLVAGTQSVVLNVDTNQDGIFNEQAVDTAEISDLQPDDEPVNVTVTYQTVSGDEPAVDVEATTTNDALGISVPVVDPVSDDELSLADYQTDGETSTPQLRQAIFDWRDDKITTRLLRDVILSWRNS